MTNTLPGAHTGNARLLEPRAGCRATHGGGRTFGRRLWARGDSLSRFDRATAGRARGFCWSRCLRMCGGVDTVLPRSVHEAIPRDLEAICVRAMALAPGGPL